MSFLHKTGSASAFTTTVLPNLTVSDYYGSHHIYLWPKYNLTFGRLQDGKRFGAYKLLTDWNEIKATPTKLNAAAFREVLMNDFQIDGRQDMPLVYYEEFLITYNSFQNTPSIGMKGNLTVYKYYDEIHYLANYLESTQYTEPASTRGIDFDGPLASLVLFNKTGGVIFKNYNDATLHRFRLDDLSFAKSYPAYDENGMHTALNTAQKKVLRFVQRRADYDAKEDYNRDVYAYYDNEAVYRCEYDTVTTKVKAVEKIDLVPTLLPYPRAGNTTTFDILTDGLIDVGKYHMVVTSKINCLASGMGRTAITGMGAWFYTFATKTWRCLELTTGLT